ncbi:MAG: NAD-dependent epimerase/dehydratase family protein [Mycobacteriales bacterium]|nr:MAG: reductase [Pseudonocardiales bacterium]
MRILSLGGTHHVGRAVVEAAIAAGHEVTTVNRGLTGRQTPGVHARTADRTDPDALRAALGEDGWDAVVDTWSGAPRVVRDAANALAGRTGHYTYISSRSVYAWPLPARLDESGAVVDGDPDSDEADDYAAAKRGGELAAERALTGCPVLLARAGLILGPYEDVGRLPWWLRRIERGGRVLAPGPADRPLQYIDARDLAAFALRAAREGVGGAVNTVSRPGHATMQELLAACIAATGATAELVWAAPAAIAEAGIAQWTELPIWTDPEGDAAGLHDGDVECAFAAGMSCRPIEETVADTWAWLQSEGDPQPQHPVGLDADREAAVLATLR